MPNRGEELPSILIRELKGADLIIHAGDWNTMALCELLQKYGPVEGVSGNTDNQDIKDAFPKSKILNAGGFSIGVVHGDGTGKTTEKRALEAFPEKPDIIIFGHSHIPYLRFVQGILLFNPGSATVKRKQPLYSFGILELDNEIKSHHIFYKDKKV
ncbi:metallophosphoesterase [Bacillus salacetis]|uniref:Phosphoesterase n=2 Tax=Bacillus salacetis TaxID=2315464 RepID=A0A3A1R0T3_9BACI|nr:metallophosphoesterase [Bacillus salacetis]